MKKTKKNHWKRTAALGLGLLMLAGTMGGCGVGSRSRETGVQTGASAGLQAGGTEDRTESLAGLQAGGTEDRTESSADSQAKEPDSQTDSSDGSGTAESQADREPVDIRVGSLKGPTSLGLLDLMDRADRGETTDHYEFQMAVGADELLPLMVKGELDIILVPANAAAVLYQKTGGGVEVIDINTLGVLYLVSGTAEVGSLADLKGKTVFLTGKGTTPEASLRYLLDANGLKEGDVTLEFKSEAAEVAAVLAENPDAIGLLPQPFVTAACMQNENLKIVLDMNEEWIRAQEVAGDSQGMVTGVTVARREFLEENPEAVSAFLEEHAASVEAVNGDPETGAALAVQAGIVAKEPIARKAIPQCNIVCVTGQEMKEALSGYLSVLHDFNRELTGGALPGDDFYFGLQ